MTPISETLGLSLGDALVKAAVLESKGQYLQAVDVLGSYWPGPGHVPHEQISTEQGCLLWLRAGTLTSVLGATSQHRGWQEQAKDTLTVAAEYSSKAGYHEIWLDTQKELGNCYWREGAFGEARAILTSAIDASSVSTTTGLLLRINLTMIDRSEHRYSEALNMLLPLTPHVQSSDNHGLRGRFHNALALSYKGMGELDSAIVEMKECCVHLELAEHKPLLTGAEINLGNWHIAASRFDAALDHLHKAIALAESMDDFVHLAHARDSAAIAYLGLKNFEAAEKEAASSVALWDLGDQYSLLVDALVNHARALAGLDSRIESCRTYLRAMSIAEERVSTQRAAKISVEVLEKLAGPLSLDTGKTYEQLVDQYKESLIDSALNAGGITEAAARLGMKHQHLSWLLKTNYPQLRRKPARLRSVFTRVSTRPRKRKKPAVPQV
jgi:tetratricopeptide (TPR) repeat protein